MALQSARQLLDELMGRERDLRPSEKHSEECEWSDERICRFFLVKFCPNQLFTNTKADMGPCHKVHDDFIKKIYEDRASRKEKSLLEDDFIRFCQQTLNDVERRIKRARARLAASQAEKNGDGNDGALNAPYLSEELQEKIQSIGEKIDELLVQIEELGCEGKVDEAQEVMKEVEKLKEEKNAIKRDNMPMHWIQQRAEIGAAQEKQMEVCDVCGAFLIVNDVQQRVDDHLMGKQHVGFGKLKTALDDLLSKRKNDATNNDGNGETENAVEAGDGTGNGGDGKVKNSNKTRLRSRSRSRDRRRNGMNRYDEKRYRNNSNRSSKNSREHRSSSSPSRRHQHQHHHHRHQSKDKGYRQRSRSRSKDRRSSRDSDRSRSRKSNGTTSPKK